MDEINLEARLLRNKVADIMEDELVKEIDRIVHEEERSCCKGCEMDDPRLHDEGGGRNMDLSL